MDYFWPVLKRKWQVGKAQVVVNFQVKWDEVFLNIKVSFPSLAPVSFTLPFSRLDNLTLGLRGCMGWRDCSVTKFNMHVGM